VASWVGEVITTGAAISTMSCALACAVGAARLLFALTRDGVGLAALGRISPTRGTPVRATAVVVTGRYAVIGATWFGLGDTKPFDLVIGGGLRTGHTRRDETVVLLRSP
jgi:amino acid transporter